MFIIIPVAAARRTSLVICIFHHADAEAVVLASCCEEFLSSWPQHDPLVHAAAVVCGGSQSS